MNLRAFSRLLHGSADPLPAGLVLAVYVVVVAAALALASIGGWFGLVAIGVILAAAVVLIVRSSSWSARQPLNPASNDSLTTPPLPAANPELPG